MARRSMLLLAVGLMASMAAPAGAWPERPGETHLISLTTDGEPANGSSYDARISPDGRWVAYQSLADNLAGEPYGKPSNLRDGFIHDRTTGEVRRVAVPEGGGAHDGRVTIDAFSADSRYLLFTTGAAGLVPDDENNALDVFMLDLQTWELERVSVGSDGQEGNDSSFGANITADNRYVVFTSYASNFSDEVPHDDFTRQIYLRDLETGSTELVSRNADGVPADGWGAHHADISADGRWVAFSSASTNLDGDNHPVWSDTQQIFLLDRDSGAVQLLSVDRAGVPGDRNSFDPRVSANGEVVTFTSEAALTPGDANWQWDIHVHERATGRLERVSIGSAGQEGTRHARDGRPSPDGRYIAFDGGRGLQDGSNTLGIMAYVHDRVTGLTEPVAVAGDGTLGQQNALSPFTVDGRLVVFNTLSKLVPEDQAGSDIYLRDRGPELGIGRLTAAAGDDTVTVSGWATFTGAVLAEASGDGAVLEAARVVYRAEPEELYVRLDLPWLQPNVNTIGVSLVPALSTGAGTPATVYGLALEVDGVRYEARVARAAETALQPAARLYRCDPVCLEVATLDGSIGGGGADARIVIPLAELEADGGSELTGLRAFAGAGDVRAGAVPADELLLGDAVIPERRVELGVVERGASPEFTTTVETSSFDATFSVPDGPADVVARACLADACSDPLPLSIPPSD